MAGKEELIASKVLELVGGAKNVISATNCMTRLRLLVNDDKKVNVAEIKRILGVISVITDGNSIQVVLGPGKAHKVADEFNKLIKITESDVPNAVLDEEARKQKEADEARLSDNGFIRFWQRFGLFFKHIKWKKGFRHIGNIFSPLVPGFIAFGILYGISCIILTAATAGLSPEVMTKWMEKPLEYLTGATKVFYCLFNFTAQGFIAYLAVLVGVNAAKEFSVTPAIGGAIGGLSIFPSLIEISKAIPGFAWKTEVKGEIIWKGLIMAGNGGILAVILAVFLIGFLERWIRKWMPDTISVVFTPLLTLLIGGTVFLFVIMPIMGYVMVGVTTAVNAMSSATLHWAVRGLIGFVLGAFFLPLVMLGLHRGLDAIYATFIADKNATPLYPIFAMADASQAGVGLAVYFKAKRLKHKRLEQNAISGVVPQILGVSEPLIYGVTLPMVKPFVCVGIGAGIAGAIVNIIGIQSAGFAVSGLMAIPIMTYINGQFVGWKAMLYYIMCWAIAVVGGFISAWFLVNEKDCNKVERID